MWFRLPIYYLSAFIEGSAQIALVYAHRLLLSPQFPRFTEHAALYPDVGNWNGEAWAPGRGLDATAPALQYTCTFYLKKVAWLCRPVHHFPNRSKEKVKTVFS